MSLPDILPGLSLDVALTLLAAFVAGLARGFSGFGASLVFVPIASAVLGPVVAIPVLLLADAAASSPLILRALRQCSVLDVWRVMLGALVGFPLGAQILTSTDPVIVRWLLTGLILAALLVLISGWRYRGRRSASVDAGMGIVSGVMSGLAQIGGPPIVIYWLGSDMGVARIRANLIVYFAFLLIVGLVIFAVKGLLTGKVLWLAAMTAPCYAVGILLGSRLFPLASPETFRRIAMALVALAVVTGMPALDFVLRGPGR